jgi:branched-subunit amino acid aminotransferase/4-amino-4-deoxychorismate lyase
MLLGRYCGLFHASFIYRIEVKISTRELFLKEPSFALSFDSNIGWLPIDRPQELPDTKGVFETFRLDKTPRGGWRGWALQRHFMRYLQGCALLNLAPLSFDTLLTGVQHVARLPEFQNIASLRIRFESTDKQSPVIIAQRFTPRFTIQTGVKLISYEMPRTMYYIKYLPATESKQSYHYALSHLADESLLIDKDQQITETSWGNFFVIHTDGRISTATHALPGICAQHIQELLGDTLIKESCTVESLFQNGASAFICNALHGIIPVTSIDGIALPRSSQAHSLADALQQKRALFEEAFFL